MELKLVISLCFVTIFGIGFIDGAQGENTFRDDYTYMSSFNAFYKYHTVVKNWEEAKRQCEQEGATLFIPESEGEAKEVRAKYAHVPVDHGHKMFGLIWFIGISNLKTEGVFETVDGRSVNSVYNKWDSGEPNNYIGGNEDCVVLWKQSVLNDVPCHDQFPFVCKKKNDPQVHQDSQTTTSTIKPQTAALKQEEASATTILGRLVEVITNQGVASDRQATNQVAALQQLTEAIRAQTASQAAAFQRFTEATAAQTASQTTAITQLAESLGLQAQNQTAVMIRIALALEKYIVNDLDIRQQ